MSVPYTKEQVEALYREGFSAFKGIMPEAEYNEAILRRSRLPQEEADIADAKAANSMLMALVHNQNPQAVFDNYDAYSKNMGLSQDPLADYEQLRNKILGSDKIKAPTGEWKGFVNSLKYSAAATEQAALVQYAANKDPELAELGLNTVADAEGKINTLRKSLDFISSKPRSNSNEAIKKRLQGRIDEIKSMMPRIKKNTEDIAAEFLPRATELESRKDSIAMQFSDAFQDFQSSENFSEAWSKFWQNPIEIFSQVSGQNSVQMAGMIAASVVGGPGGAVAGAEISRASEYNAEFFNHLKEAGIDTTNQDEVLDAYINKPDLIISANNRARIKSSVVSGMDLVSMNSAGKFVSLARSIGQKSGSKMASKSIRMLGHTAEAGQQIVTEGGGEALGSYLATGEVSGVDIFSEIIGQGPQSVAEYASGVRRELRSDKWKELTLSKSGEPLTKEEFLQKAAQLEESDFEGLQGDEGPILKDAASGNPDAGDMMEAINHIENERESVVAAQEDFRLAEEVGVKKEVDEIKLLTQGIEPATQDRLGQEIGADPDQVEVSPVEVRPGDPRDSGISPGIRKATSTNEEKLVQQKNDIALKAKQAARKIREEFQKKIAKVREDLNEKGKQAQQVLRDQQLATTDAIRQLESVVNAMPAEVQKRFSGFAPLSRIKDLDTLERKLNERLDRLSDLYLVERKKFAKRKIEDIDKRVSDAEKSAAKGPGGKPFKYGPETRKQLALAGYGDQSVRERAQVLFENLIERQMAATPDNPFVYSEADIQIEREGMIPNLKEGSDWDIDSLNSYLEDLNSIIKDGVDAFKARQAKRKESADKKAAVAKAEIDANIKKSKKNVRPEDTARRNQFLSKVGTKLQELLDIRSVLTGMTGKMDSNLRKILIDPITDGVSDSIINHTKYTQFVNDTAKRHGIKLEKSGAVPLVQVGDATMTIYEAMFVYGHSQNERGLAHLKNTIFGGIKLRGEVDRISNSLPQAYKDFVDDLIDYNDNVMYPRLNELFMERFGVKMPRESRYLPVLNLHGKTAFDLIFQDTVNFLNIDTGFMKARTDSVEGFRTLDLIGSLESHNASAEHAIALYDALIQAQNILNNKGLQDSINQISPKYIPYLKKWLQNVGRGELTKPSSDLVALLRWVRNNVRTFFLAANVGSWLKTQAPMFAALQSVGKQYAASAAKTHLSKSNWKIAKEKSKFMATRPHTSRIEIMELVQRSVGGGKMASANLTGKAKQISRKMQELAYSVYTPLDIAASSTVWVAKYNEGINTHGNEARAIRDADDVVRRFFPSGRIDELPPIFQSQGLEKELTIFTADMNRMLNLGYSISQMRDPKLLAAINYATYSVLLTSLYLAGTDMVWDGLREALGIKEEEEDRNKRFWADASRYSASQIVGGIPLFGSVVEAKIADAWGDDGLKHALAKQTPVFAYPAAQAINSNYGSAVFSLFGVPGGNIFGKKVDEFMELDDGFEATEF